MKIFVIIFCLLLSSAAFPSDGFYLKLSDYEATLLIETGMSQMFGSETTAFDEYTYYILDEQTGYKYWRVENIQKKGVYYDVIDWLDVHYPSLIRYDDEFVSQFLPEPEI